MNKAIILSMLVAVVAARRISSLLPNRNPGSENLPRFCNGINCPMFTKLNETQDYEVRLYPATSWMSTNLQGVPYEGASYPMFMKLFQYIRGRNERNEKIPMTCPVLKKITPGPDASWAADFTMSFFNDPSLGAPPAPTDNGIFVENMGASVVYVRSFGGFATDVIYRDNAMQLGEALERDGLGNTFIQGHYYTAGYDAPFKFRNRHNEVWFIKK